MTSKRLPNIIIITTDQQRLDTLGCYGNSFIKTPNLDQVAAEGVKFNRAYCTNGLCTPSRTSIFTGKYVHNHGIWQVGVKVPDDIKFITHILNKSGYRTHLIGKAHLSPYGYASEDNIEYNNFESWKKNHKSFAGPYHGFKTVELALGHTLKGISGHYGLWVEEKSNFPLEVINYAKRATTKEFGGAAFDWKLPTRLHNSSWTAERSIDFLNNRGKSNEPFFLSINFQDPHHPHAVPMDYENRVEPEDVPLPIKKNEKQMESLPHVRAAYDGSLKNSKFRGEFGVAGQKGGGTYKNINEKDVRISRAYYYTMVQLIDEQIGRIFDTLTKLGLFDRTIVLFTTDHGELLGDHGLWQKGPFHFESIIQVPLIIRYPGVLPEGYTEDSLVSLVDIAPTIFSLIGLSVNYSFDGHDLTTVFSKKSNELSKRKGVLVESRDDPKGLRLRTIVTKRYKLTYYHEQSFGELYDFKSDPYEINNLWFAEEYIEIKNKLLQELLDLIENWGPTPKRLSRA